MSSQRKYLDQITEALQSFLEDHFVRCKSGTHQLKNLIKRCVEKQLASTINRDLLNMEFPVDDTYVLWNYFASNFFVSTGGGASLKFLEMFLKNQGSGDLASFLPGTSTLMELTVV